MIQKHPLIPERIRKVPSQFSWVDQRLVRDRHIECITHCAAALYLFLVTVADAKGLSYYSDGSIMTRLSMVPADIEEARCNLVSAGLIAFKKPLYQVLSLEPRLEASPPTRTSLHGPVSIGQILSNMKGGLS